MVWGPQETREDGGRRAESLVSDCSWCPVWPQGWGSLFLPVFSCSYLINTPCSPRELWKDSSRVTWIWSTGSVSEDILICAQVCSLECHWLPLVWFWWNWECWVCAEVCLQFQEKKEWVQGWSSFCDPVSFLWVLPGGSEEEISMVVIW